MSSPFFRLALLPALFPCAAMAAAPAPDLYADRIDQEAMDQVILYINHKDCKGAVKALNQGLASKQPGVMLMAGSMFEQGLCVKADWDRASHFYQLAHLAGRQEALPRLISGYAENNRDPGSALWWMASSNSLPAACTSANHLAKDPEAFVAALNKWPKGQIEACVYTAGVLMRVTGDIEFPGNAVEKGVFGDAVMHFNPSNGTITWTNASSERIAVTRLVDGSDNTERGAFKDTLLKHVSGVGARALGQFKRPEGIDPSWIVETKFSFTYK